MLYSKFNGMRYIALVIFTLLGASIWAKAQENKEHQIYLELEKLAKLKYDSEKYERNDVKRDTTLALYKTHLNKIKKSPEVYLKYINDALKSNKAQISEEKISYKYMPTTGGGYFNPRWYRIKRSDFYRVIRFSLFKRNDDVLPKDFRGLPVIDEKNYNGYDKAKRSDFKIASRYLLQNLTLAAQDVAFIKNDNNQMHVLDMKKYLDEYGLNEENKEFIKWAIDYIIESPEVSLYYLDNVYDAIRYKDYRPRDKEN